jgi:hypothetical protein
MIDIKTIYIGITYRLYDLLSLNHIHMYYLSTLLSILIKPYIGIADRIYFLFSLNHIKIRKDSIF